MSHFLIRLVSGLIACCWMTSCLCPTRSPPPATPLDHLHSPGFDELHLLLPLPHFDKEPLLRHQCYHLQEDGRLRLLMILCPWP
ncbi:hypothetical protein M758_UG149700 [Ceratodon purpureus]|nr:hypothetical protein M758_UG149700 [Ceratodon purpureus]